MIWTDNMLIPTGGDVFTASTYMNFVYDPEIAAQIAAYVNYVTPVKGAKEEAREDRPGAARRTRSIFPDDETLAKVSELRREGAQQPGLHRAVADAARQRRTRSATDGDEPFFHRHRWLAPYLLLLPGIAWLAVFFVVPLGFLAYQSLQSGLVPELRVHLGVLQLQRRALATTASSSSARSGLRGDRDRCWRSRSATRSSYWIAFRAGRWKNLFLLFIVAPFFVTYLIRTLAWQTILSDHGPGGRASCATVGCSADDGRLLATSTAVVAGITYNFLPFMALPLYVVARADRPAAARGGRGPLREPDAGVPARDAAALAARGRSPARC